MNIVDPSFAADVRNAIDAKTKPVGALGELEAVAARIALIQKTLKPRAESCLLTIFAGDHGMASSGVSAYPQDVTRQMVLNFLTGGAAANVFARATGADVQVVDAGVAGARLDHPDLLDRRIAAGTQNAIEGPAMSVEQAGGAIEAGRRIGETVRADVACFGEMGIGNTSSASLVASKILGVGVADLAGRGTGLDDDGFARKRALLEKAALRTQSQLDVETALREYGGFEITMMAGAMTGAARAGRIVIVDGFIAAAAALCARAMTPGCEEAFFYGHKSAERGHVRVLQALNARPLLDLDMRLGEGTGALLAWPLVKAAAAMLREMASFESAGVSGPA